MAEGVYNHARFLVGEGTVLFTSSGPGVADTTFGIMLVSTDYTFDITQDVIDDGTTDDPASYEPSTTTGYARQSIGSRTVTEDDTGNRGDIDVADVTFSSVSSGAGVIGGAIIYAELAATDTSGRRLISYYDTGFPVTPNGGDITIQWSTGGILQLTT